MCQHSVRFWNMIVRIMDIALSSWNAVVCCSQQKKKKRKCPEAGATMIHRGKGKEASGGGHLCTFRITRQSSSGLSP